MNSSLEIYNDIEASSEMMSASPHRLIQLLLEHCLQQINLAEQYIIKKDMNKRHHCISKAMNIITHLRECLTMQNDTMYEISKLLDTCYKYIGTNLVLATLYNDVEYLKLAYTSLLTIKLGWDSIAQ